MRKHKNHSVAKDIVLTFFVAFEVTMFIILGIVLYNYKNGYAWNTIPDRSVVVNFRQDGLKLRSIGKVRSRSIDKAIDALYKLDGVAYEQGRYGVRIVSSKNIKQIDNPNNIYSNDPSEYRTAAYYSPATNEIVICDDDKVQEHLYHEMGHYVDYNYYAQGKITDSDGWAEITAAEFPNTGWDLYFSRPSEFWAECFSAYMDDPGWLYCHCTKAFYAIDSVMAHYELPDNE